jgi:hypothetical protein
MENNKCLKPPISYLSVAMWLIISPGIAHVFSTNSSTGAGRVASTLITLCNRNVKPPCAIANVVVKTMVSSMVVDVYGKYKINQTNKQNWGGTSKFGEFFQLATFDSR